MASRDEEYGVSASAAVPAPPATPAAPATPATPASPAAAASSCSDGGKPSSRAVSSARPGASGASFAAPGAFGAIGHLGADSSIDATRASASAPNPSAPRAAATPRVYPDVSPRRGNSTPSRGSAASKAQKSAHRSKTRPSGVQGKSAKKHPKARPSRPKSIPIFDSEDADGLRGMGLLITVVCLLWVLWQLGGCVAACSRSAVETIQGAPLSRTYPYESSNSISSSASGVEFVDDEGVIAEVTDVAELSLKALANYDSIVDRVSTSLADDIDSTFELSASECGVDTRELARWLIGTAEGTIDDGDVFVYTNGTASVYAEMNSVAAYRYIAAAKNLTVSQPKWNSFSAEQKKAGIASALDVAKGGVEKSSTYIMFQLKKDGSAWVLDEQAFLSTADHLFGL